MDTAVVDTHERLTVVNSLHKLVHSSSSLVVASSIISDDPAFSIFVKTAFCTPPKQDASALSIKNEGLAENLNAAPLCPSRKMAATLGGPTSSKKGSGCRVRRRRRVPYPDLDSDMCPPPLPRAHMKPSIRQHGLG